MTKTLNIIALSLLFVLVSCKVTQKGKEGMDGAAGTSAKQQAKIETGITSFFIDSTTVRKHLYTLASDEMEGRKSGTPGIEKAAK